MGDFSFRDLVRGGGQAGVPATLRAVDKPVRKKKQYRNRAYRQDLFIHWLLTHEGKRVTLPQVCRALEYSAAGPFYKLEKDMITDGIITLAHQSGGKYRTYHFTPEFVAQHSNTIKQDEAQDGVVEKVEPTEEVAEVVQTEVNNNERLADVLDNLIRDYLWQLPADFHKAGNSTVSLKEFSQWVHKQAGSE